jgi:hypothetical protein
MPKACYVGKALSFHASICVLCAIGNYLPSTLVRCARRRNVFKNLLFAPTMSAEWWPPKAEWPAVLANRNKIGLTTTCFEQAGAEEKVLIAAIVG